MEKCSMEQMFIVSGKNDAKTFFLFKLKQELCDKKDRRRKVSSLINVASGIYNFKVYRR